MPTDVPAYTVALMIAGQTVGALTEEIGFRGVLLPVLSSQMRPFRAALLTGLVFGLWHVQYFGLPIAQHLAFLLGAVVMTLTMAAVMVGSFWQRMVVCTIIHTGANLALEIGDDDNASLTAICVAILIGYPTAIALTQATGRRRENERRRPRRTIRFPPGDSHERHSAA